jgi:hypothetical protein
VSALNNAERIGYLPFLGWFVSGPLAATLFAWLLTPVGVYVLAFILESRRIGRDFRPFKDAFRGFMPGDVFLGISFGQFVWQLEKFKNNSPEWCRSWWWHLIVACGAVVVALVVRDVNDRPLYFPRAMRSPTKLYHDFVIYMGFGYMFFCTMVTASVVSRWDHTLQMPYAFLAGWVACLIYDGTRSKVQKMRMAASSHPYHWYPIWAPHKMK